MIDYYNMTAIKYFVYKIVVAGCVVTSMQHLACAVYISNRCLFIYKATFDLEDMRFLYYFTIQMFILITQNKNKNKK